MAEFLLDDYIKEAGADPYILNCGDLGKFVIEYPNGEVIAQLTETPINQTRRVAQLLLGEHYETVWSIVAPLDGAVLVDMTNDIIQHFGLDQMGKSREARRAGRRSSRNTGRQ